MASKLNRRSRSVELEPLETRQHLCLAHMPHVPVTKATPVKTGIDQLVVAKRGSTSTPMATSSQSTRTSDPADIVWMNRATTTTGGAADTDGFGAVFGTSAPQARAVVDAVIGAYEKMIGSFNYGVAGSYGLTLSMDGGSGYGGALTQIGFYQNKPAAGWMSINTGNNSANANDDNGWFLDPTPNDNSEFAGTITNAFAGDAQAGSPAAGKADFYTVVANEMTHAMGLIGSYTPLWASHTVNTGVTDTSEGQGTGSFWVFNGPSIKHLLTSDNGGPALFGGLDTGMALHGAGPGVPVTYNGDTYVGAEDQGNAVFELGRRYLVNQTFSLMFKDAYGYATTDAAASGTFYSNLNQTSKVLTVRGGDFATGQANSSDTITISRSGNTVTVSVDAGNDVPGTGALPGAGNLPAWVSQYDVSQISSITVDAGAGDDAVNVSAQLGLPVTVEGGAGADVVNFDEPGVGQQMVANSGGFSAGTTTVSIAGGIEAGIMSGNGNASQMLVLATAPGRPLLIFGGPGSETITVSTTTAASYPAPLQVINGGGGNDVLEVYDSTIVGGTSVYNVTPGSLTKSNGFAGLNYSDVDRVSIVGETGPNAFNVSGGATPIWLDGGATQDTYNILDGFASAPPRVVNAFGSDVLNVNTDGGAGTVYAETAAGQSYGAINVAPLSRLDVVAGSNSFVKTASLSVSFPAHLNLNDNDLILDYTGASQLAATQNLINTARAGGAWNGLMGVTSFTARDNTSHNTTLGAMEATDYKAIYGAGATFDGQSIDNDAVLVKYTYYGDANFSGRVTFDDYVKVDTGFNQHRTGWTNGDFNGDGTVNFDDYVLIDTAFNTQGAVL